MNLIGGGNNRWIKRNLIDGDNWLYCRHNAAFSVAVHWWRYLDFISTRLLHQALLSPWLSPALTTAACRQMPMS